MDCMDCGTPITSRATRCGSCAMRQSMLRRRLAALTHRGAACPRCARFPRFRWLRQALAMAGLLLTLVVGADAGQNVLTWTDNAPNETTHHVERTQAADVAACQAAGGWTEIVTLGANVTTFTDAAVSEGVTYCYRVKASNPAGSSPYSNVAGRSVPFSVPSAPSGLQVGP